MEINTEEIYITNIEQANISDALLVTCEIHILRSLCHEAFALLKENKKINFVGNMEAREIMSGDYDVVVCDGFAGNVAMKAAEGTLNAFMTVLKREVKEGGVGSKLGAEKFLQVKTIFISRGAKTKRLRI